MKTNRIVPVIIAAVGLLCGISACGSRTPEGQIKAAVDMLNAALPMDVDEFTRADSIGLRGGNVMVYYYTIDPGTSAHLLEEIDIEDIMRDGVIESIKEDTELNALKDLDVTFLFTYRDTDGQLLFEVEVPPAVYAK